MAHSPERAIQLLVAAEVVTPFQGWKTILGLRFPGRCPGLICCGPFGANSVSLSVPSSPPVRTGSARCSRFRSRRATIRVGLVSLDPPYELQ
jgi:hypothetical protein